jgi:cAMP phosphodiesterase
MLKTHCVTNLRASTQRWACCVLELLSYKLSSSRNINGKPVKEDAFFLVKSRKSRDVFRNFMGDIQNVIA